MIKHEKLKFECKKWVIRNSSWASKDADNQRDLTIVMIAKGYLLNEEVIINWHIGLCFPEEE